MNDLVSVIVPVYNVQKYLIQNLDSLINQTVSGYEIIAVNDGSTDDSLNILLEYQKKCSSPPKNTIRKRSLRCY